MKESERLHQIADQEENDLKYLGLKKKAIREERLERFQDYIFKLEALDILVAAFDGSKHTIDTQRDEFGIIDYFPKANKVLIRKENRWITQGLKWIVTTFLK